jgi:hypothetical protein
MNKELARFDVFVDYLREFREAILDAIKAQR